MFKTTLPPHLLFVTDGDNDGGTDTQQQDGKGDADGGQPQAGKTFTQAEVDRLLGERAARERAKFPDYDTIKAKAERLDAHEAEQQTEAERAANALAEANRRAEAAAQETVRYKAAAQHGIGSDHFDLIGSGDEAAVMDRAQRIGALLASERELAELKAAQDRVPVSGRPVPALRPGAVPGDVVEQPSAVDEAREAALRRGRITTSQ